MTDRILTALAGLIVGLFAGALLTWHSLGTPDTGWDQRAGRAEVAADSALALVRRVRVTAREAVLAADRRVEKAENRAPRIAWRKAQVQGALVPEDCRTLDALRDSLEADLDSSLTDYRAGFDLQSEGILALNRGIDSVESSLDYASEVLEDRPKRKPWLLRLLPRPQLGVGLVLPLSVGSVPGFGVYAGLGWHF